MAVVIKEPSNTRMKEEKNRRCLRRCFMRIISWNCNGKFRAKYKQILRLDGDIYIIQECESPNKFIEKELIKITADCIWEKGAYKKGVLIFSKKNIKLEKQKWDNYGMRVFVPVLVNDKFILVGVWTTSPAYIEEFYIWQAVHEKRICKDTVLIGDFNSNAIWDKGHNNRCHSDVVRILQEKGLKSVYHYCCNEKQGVETIPTFFLHKNKQKAFHIDHCFASENHIESYEVLDDSWLKISDHVPIVFNMNEILKSESEE